MTPRMNGNPMTPRMNGNPMNGNPMNMRNMNMNTMRPVQRAGGTNQISTSYGSKIKVKGNMFDILAIEERLKIPKIYIFAERAEKTTVEVWTKIGTYSGNESRKNKWTKVHVEDIIGKGSSTPVHLNNFKCPIVVGAGEIQAFYVYSSSRILFSTSANKSGALIKNADAELNRGVSLPKLFGVPNPNYLWDGGVSYETNFGETNCSWQRRAPATGMLPRKNPKPKRVVVRRKKPKTKRVVVQSKKPKPKRVVVRRKKPKTKRVVPRKKNNKRKRIVRRKKTKPKQMGMP